MINTAYFIQRLFRNQKIAYLPKLRFSDQQDTINGLTISEYKTLTNGFLEDLSEIVENLQNPHIEDVELSEGVLKIFSRQAKTFVINRQTPNRQLWYSSPVSGPQRFSYNIVQKQWTNSQSKNIQELLLEEINKIQ